MKEYIEREAALKAFEPQCGDWSECWSAEEIKPKLESIPAADVVEVVRCRDCKMANPCSDEREMYCTLNHCYKKNNYFCADGERKGGDE